MAGAALEQLRDEARADAAVKLLAHLELGTLEAVSETDAVEAVVAALEACGNNASGGRLTCWLSKALFNGGKRIRRSAFVAAGVIEALVRRLPCTGGGGSTSAAESLFYLCLDSAEIAQEIRDTPGVLEALHDLEETSAPHLTHEKALLWKLNPIAPTGRLTKAARAAAPAPGSGKEEEEEEE